jgi:SH3-like domain-containing protein
MASGMSARKRLSARAFFLTLPLALSLAMLAVPAHAAHDEKDIPYWGSLRDDEVHMRVGPGKDYRINWIYRRKHLPVKVLRAMEGWRLIEDPDGARGWMLQRFVLREREVMVASREPAPMREAGDADARLLWRLDRGVVARLGECADGWCKVEVEGRSGYVEQAHLWGTATLAQ